MRFVVACLLLTACEKAGGVEATGGTSSHDDSKPTGVRSNVVATLPNDAGVDAATVAVVADAAVVRPKPDPKQIDDDARAYADLLTSDDNGKYAGDMSARRPGADLGRQIDDAKNGGTRRIVAIGGGVGRGNGNPGTTGTAAVGGSMNPPSTSGRVSVSNKQTFDDSTLTPDMVLVKIQSAYMAGIKRCYKGALSKDPAARGKITLSFTVNDTGRAVAAKATGFDNELDGCITGLMASWRFPAPKDKDGEPTEAAFSIGITVVPD